MAEAAALDEENLTETIASTEPSPDSALEFELDSLALSADREADSDHVGEAEIDFDPEQIALAGDDDAVPVDSVSDSAFGRAVEAFSGDLTGSIVESTVSDTETIDESFAFDPAETNPSPLILSPEAIELSTAGIPTSEVNSPLDKLDELADSRPPMAADEINLTDEGSLLETDPGRVLPAEPAIDPFDLSAAEAFGDDLTEPGDSIELSTAVSDIASGSEVASDATIAPSVEGPAAATVSTPDDVAPISSATSAPTPHRPPMTPEERGQFWGTAATVLGGMPLILPEARATPLFSDGDAVQPPSNTIDEDEQIDAVSQMIGELLDEAVPPPAPASDAGNPSSEISPDPATPPKRNRRPLTGLPIGAPSSETTAKSPRESLRIDEQIPPFGSVISEQKSSRSNRRDTNGRREESAAAMDSLSRPPVHETDVFSHGSMPSEDLLAPDGASEDPLAPRGRSRALPVTPMDLLGDPSSPPAGNGRRPRNGLRGPAAPSIGRINLPNDPFWSGGGNGSGNKNRRGAKFPAANIRRAAKRPTGKSRRKTRSRPVRARRSPTRVAGWSSSAAASPTRRSRTCSGHIAGFLSAEGGHLKELSDRLVNWSAGLNTAAPAAVPTWGLLWRQHDLHAVCPSSWRRCRSRAVLRRV